MARIVASYTRRWQDGRRWLHDPHCACASRDGSALAWSDFPGACGCGSYYDEAPQEWRDLDAQRYERWLEADREAEAQEGATPA